MLLTPHRSDIVGVSTAEAAVRVASERVGSMVAVRSVQSIGRARRRAGFEEGSYVVGCGLNIAVVVVDDFT